MSSVAISLLLPLLKKIGAPILEKIVEKTAGEKGRIVARFALEKIADSLGIDKGLPDSTLIESIKDRATRNPDDFADAVNLTETFLSEYKESVEAHLVVKEINETMRAEISAESRLTRIWRPIFGLGFTVSFVALCLTVCVCVLFGRAQAISSLSEVAGLLTGMYGTGAAVLGVYVWGRTKEKEISK